MSRLIPKLPPTWVWTGSRSLGASGTIYYARDSRWEPTIPDLAGLSRERVAADALECAEAWARKHRAADEPRDDGHGPRYRCTGRDSAKQDPPCPDRQSMSATEAEQHFEGHDHDCEAVLLDYHLLAGE